MSFISKVVILMKEPILVCAICLIIQSVEARNIFKRRCAENMEDRLHILSECMDIEVQWL